MLLRSAGDPRIKVALIRAPIPLAALFRELPEMRHLCGTPVRMDNKRLLSIVGVDPHTPLGLLRITLLNHDCSAIGRHPPLFREEGCTFAELTSIEEYEGLDAGGNRLGSSSQSLTPGPITNKGRMHT